MNVKTLRAILSHADPDALVEVEDDNDTWRSINRVEVEGETGFETFVIYLKP